MLRLVRPVLLIECNRFDFDQLSEGELLGPCRCGLWRGRNHQVVVWLQAKGVDRRWRRWSVEQRASQICSAQVCYGATRAVWEVVLKRRRIWGGGGLRTDIAHEGDVAG